MAASTSLASSQQLLKRFMAREVGRVGRAGTSKQQQAQSQSQSSNSNSNSTSIIPSTSSSFPVPSWTSSNNPFLRSKNQAGRLVKPLYSLRRQKMLHRAMERVQEASTPSTSTSTSFVLPPGSPKASTSIRQQQKDSATTSRLLKLKDASSSRSSNAASSPVKIPLSGNAKMRQAMQSGPYKGRSIAFKGHKWEREAESVRAEREEKIKGMPARIAEYTRARAAARAASKPSLPF